MRPLVLLVVLLLTAGASIAQTGAKPTPTPAPTGVFSDLATDTGLDFTHFNGMTGKLYLPEIMGAGAAVFDYDNDGDLDVFLVQGKILEPNKKPSDAVFPWTSKDPPTGRLFRNDLKTNADGTRSLRFTDVTKESRIDADGYGFGVVTGDINNDGFIDLYLCNLDNNKLFLNKGDGTFEDVTSKSMTDDPRWSIGGSFFDYNRDGWLDLIVINYAIFDVADPPDCYAKTTARDYCGPKSYKAVGNSLFRNKGDGTFENVTVSSGLNEDFGHALGVITADLNGDGWIDIYVANDGDANQLWVNQKNGSFENEGLISGTAFNREGKAEASMGADAGDINGDGLPEIFITHLIEETHTLYVNEGEGVFEDITPSSNIGLPDLRLTGFGTLMFDYDNDCLLDIFVANGSVKLLRDVFRPGNTGAFDPKYPLGQQNQLFRNLGGGKFEDVSYLAGPKFKELNVSRGAAFGDIDNDGDVDIVVSNNSGKAELLINNHGNKNGWLGIRLIGRKGGRDMLGANAEITLSSKMVLNRRARTDGSYSSSQDPRILAGLGASDSVVTVLVTWPDGQKEAWNKPGKNKYIELVQGSGTKK